MTFTYFLLGLILISILYFIYLQYKNSRKDYSQELTNKLNEIFPQVLKNANQQLITMADQKIGTDLQNKKDSIEKMVKQVLGELTKNQSKLEIAERDRIGSFMGLKESLDTNQKLTQQLKVTADSLKNVLSNNQLRGAFGEQVAEDLLKQSGFVIGTDYTKQESSGSSRPDFTLYLPDQTKVNIDSKFPYANIVKMSETEDATEKKRYLKLFQQDLKSKISEVSTRDYIDPESNTVDFVLLFIPNEMIFSFIYEKFPDLLQEAYQKKIVLAGPFSFTAILRMVRQAHDNFHYQKNIQSIITQIKLFENEFSKFNEEFDKMGPRIDSLSRQFNQVNSTRSNKLLRVIDKIKLEEPNNALPLISNAKKKTKK